MSRLAEHRLIEVAQQRSEPVLPLQGDTPRRELTRYHRGRGGLPRSAIDAGRLYKQAADQGDTQGQAYLGNIYERGMGGLPKNDTEAVRLYTLAARQGNIYAQNALKRLGKGW